MPENKDIYDRFLSELEDAIDEGVEVHGQFTYEPYETFNSAKSLQAVLKVIAKYRAVPNEPIVPNAE